MDCEEDINAPVPRAPGDDESRNAVNSLVLDYYKKFGRKRDLEQYFSLSTAQSDIRDPSSIFWARMKADNESSDSGERSDKKSESSQELCRISIRFPAQDPSVSQDEDSKTKTESTSPPIIIEELPQDSRHNSDDEGSKSEDEAIKSDDNNSQKSFDVLLDTSLNKLHSPSSSITSQRRLEWDSLADVGYANESDRKTSASSLSTLERLALKQQYSNDSQQNSNIGVPTAHSTPLDENDAKYKIKKGMGKKGTKIYKKDVDIVEVNVPHSSNMNPQSINVNLTKHISFNVEKNGKVTVDNILKNVSVSPENKCIEIEASPPKIDREMQTSLTKASMEEDASEQKIPILISLNTLKSRVRRRRLRMARRKLKTKKRASKENIPVQEKSGEQLSEAESFEYMPGHIYNQNQMTVNRPVDIAPPNVPDNKSSLESSGILSSSSSKGSKHSFTKDLEKSIDLLKSALKQRCDDSTLRKQLIQQVCQRLLNSKYRDDESTTDFLSGLSFSSKKLGLSERNNTTTSTSEANNSAEKQKKPKKSILRSDKFNAGSIASTSQSVPNLPTASKSENPVTSNLTRNLTNSNTDSDMSSKDKTSSDNGFAKTSSEELYQKYLQAFKREEAYKKHLKDKEMFLKQKLVCSDSALKVPPVRLDAKQNIRLKDLMYDLTRNNYDDGSGDASKLEGGASCHSDFDRFLPNRAQRSHSVFTLSSGASEGLNKKPNLKKKVLCESKDLSKPGTSKESHYCCCPHHGNLKFADSSVQVNMKNASIGESNSKQCKKEHEKLQSPKRSAKLISDDVSGNLKYVCLCSKNIIQEAPDDFLIYKCSRLNNKGVQLEDTSSKSSNEVYIQCSNDACTKKNMGPLPSVAQSLNNKSSQTNMLIKMLHEQPTNNLTYTSDENHIQISGQIEEVAVKSTTTVYEATRCIQTEISIDPKICEPTLSDINIISDNNCAELISEHHREITKPSITDISSNQAVASTSGLSESYISTGTSKNIGKTTNSNIRDEIETNIKETTNHESTIEHSENFTIPIQGTNMTLMVTIGSERAVNVNRNHKEMVTECIGTEKVNAIEQATSLREECSKAVQSENITDNPQIIDHNSNNIENRNVNIYNLTSANLNKALIVNPCLVADASRPSTYPKTSPVSDRKSFRRASANSDKCKKTIISRSIEECFNQRKNSIRSDVGTECNPNHREICPCGCKGVKENCKEDCYGRKSSLIQKEQSQIQSCNPQPVQFSNKKQCGTQYGEQISPDRSFEQKDKCSCGCGGSTATCKKSCKERKSSLKNESQENEISQCGKRSVEKEIQTQRDSSNENCPCGCGGTIDRCKKSCKSVSSPRNDGQESSSKSCKKQPTVNTQTDSDSATDQCAKLPSEREIDNQAGMSRIQREKCCCGCSGFKDNCKNSCKEYDSSPRNKVTDIGSSCSKQPIDKNVDDTQAGMSRNQRERCSCGCSGFKDNCKKICKECGSSPRNKVTDIKNSCSKQSIDKNMDTHKNQSPTRTNTCSSSSEKELDKQSNNYFTKYEKCPCGCGGEKNKCDKTCKACTPRDDNTKIMKQCGTRSYKQTDTQTNTSPNSTEDCLCGCGGTKDNCQNDCSDLQSTPREQCKKKHQTIYTTTCTPDLNNDKCSCGCGGTKNTCPRRCKGIQSTQESKTQTTDKNQVGNQINNNEPAKRPTRRQEQDEPNPSTSRNTNFQNTANSGKCAKPVNKIECGEDKSDKSQKSSSETEPESGSDPILNLIKNITKKYTKNDVEKNRRKKCFKEIMTVLNYLLDTDESPDEKETQRNQFDSTSAADETETSVKKVSDKSSCDKSPRKVAEKCVQPSKKVKPNHVTESSEVVTSTDIPGTSSDSAACKVLSKIKKECEKYHQKRCKIHGKVCDGTSSTSINCDQCRRVHHCQCRTHKCKNQKKWSEKARKNAIAYNLILQTSESVVSEGPSTCEKTRTLKNIIVKVPKKKHCSIPFRELEAKFEKHMSCETPKERCCRSKSLPNESDISSMEDIIRKSQGATVREYLEKNRPDFIEKCGQRQTCMRYISESRAAERAVKRDLLSLHLARLPDVTELDPDEMRRLAAELGRCMRDKQPAPKFINEREMKKHSEKIYKSLPEVVQKKEEKRKENIKKTNLLMANMFKRNLQKKTLRGSVNLSNYSTVIKI